MRFVADMGIGARVVRWLRENADEVKHLTEEGLQRLPNGEIFDKAIRENGKQPPPRRDGAHFESQEVRRRASFPSTLFQKAIARDGCAWKQRPE